MLKKVFKSLLFIFVIAIIGIMAFVVVFKPDRYKYLIIERISHNIQKEIDIGRISLKIIPALGLRIYDVRIKDKGTMKEILRLGRLDISVKILPLLKRELRIQQLELYRMEMDLSNEMFGLMTERQPSSRGDINPSIIAGGALKSMIGTIIIRDSVIGYLLPNGKKIKIGITDTIINNISSKGPVRISAVISIPDEGKDNLIIKGIVFPEFIAGSSYIKDLHIKFDLHGIEFSDILTILEMFGQQKISKTLRGRRIDGFLSIYADRLYLEPKKILDSTISFNLSRFATDILPLGDGVKDVELDAGLKQDRLIISKLTGSVGDGIFLLHGSVDNISSSPYLDLDISLKGVNLSKIVPAIKDDAPYLDGITDFKVKVKGKGVGLPAFFNNLNGSGMFNIDNMRLKNVNILKLAFEKMDIIPGLVNRLKEYLPEDYYDILKRKDTYFKPLHINFDIIENRLIFQNAFIESDGFSVKSSGSITSSGSIAIDGQIFIAPTLSKVFVEIVRELKSLMDERGMINIPITITGDIPHHISINIDRDYIIKKIIISKGSEVLEDIFKRKEEAGETPYIPEGQESDINDNNRLEPEGVIKSIFKLIDLQDR